MIFTILLHRVWMLKMGGAVPLPLYTFHGNDRDEFTFFINMSRIKLFRHYVDHAINPESENKSSWFVMVLQVRNVFCDRNSRL